MIVSIIMVQSSTIRPHMQELQDKVSREGVRTRSQTSDASHCRIETNLVSLSVSFSRLAEGLKVCKN